MSTNVDEELQRMAEAGHASDTANRDLMAYRQLFSILGQQPEYRRTHIEDAVIARIEKTRKRSVVLDHVWLVIGVLFLIGIGIAAVAISGFNIPLSGWQREIMALGICAGVVIALLNTIERKLLRTRKHGR